MTAKLAVSVPEAAEMVSLPKSTIWAEVAAGNIRSFKQGKRRLIRVVSLEAWLERRELLASQVVRLPVGPRTATQQERAR